MFLPGGTVIEQKPALDVHWERWKNDLNNLAMIASEKIQTFLSQSEHRTGQTKRNRGISVNVSSTYKRLACVQLQQKKLQKGLRDLILPTQFPIVVDHACIM